MNGMAIRPPLAQRTTRRIFIFALTFPAFLTWIYFVVLADQPAPLQQTIYTVGKSIQFLLPIIGTMLMVREPVSHRLFQTNGWREGLFFGVGSVLLMIMLYYWRIAPLGIAASAGGEIRLKLAGFGITTTTQYAVMSVFYALIHSGLEEYYWRWFVFGRLRTMLSVRHATIVSSLGFSAHHILVLGLYFGFASLTTWAFAFAVTVGGAYWCGLYQRSGSLVTPWLSHALIDGGIFVLGYQMMGSLG